MPWPWIIITLCSFSFWRHVWALLIEYWIIGTGWIFVGYSQCLDVISSESQYNCVGSYIFPFTSIRIKTNRIEENIYSTYITPVCYQGTLPHIQFPMYSLRHWFHRVIHILSIMDQVSITHKIKTINIIFYSTEGNFPPNL